MDRLDVFNNVLRHGLVPCFYHVDADTCLEALRIGYENGLRSLEFTNRGVGAYRIFSVMRRYSTQHCPGLALGAGTIGDPATAALYIQEGADFIVSPSLNLSIAPVCHRSRVAWIPGCQTVTEITSAEEAGAELIKLFPASAGGPGFLKAVQGPLPKTKFLVTGDVTIKRDNLEEWFNAGATAVGLCSQLFKKDWLNARSFLDLGGLIKEVVDTIHQIKNRAKHV